MSEQPYRSPVMDKLEVVAWYRPADKVPEAGHKFVALCDDGYGAWLGFAHDDGFIDAGGSEYERMPECEWWAYLPTGFELWCEGVRGDAFTLPAHVIPHAPAQAEIDRLRGEVARLQRLIDDATAALQEPGQ